MTEPDQRPSPTEPFSVLLPVYAGDRSDWLTRAFESVTTDQLLPPNEVVLVRDGPVPGELEATIAVLLDSTDLPVTYLPLARNLRLAGALAEGLTACQHDLVARADADDICFPRRFASQIPAMGQLDLLGSAMVEFHVESELANQLGPHEGGRQGDSAARAQRIRSRPTNARQIRSYAAFHNPFNHPSVVLRKGAVQTAGGYQDMPLLEDYWLFVRMIASGARVGNLDDVLVGYRVGDQLFERRGGMSALRSDWRFQLHARALGITTRAQFVRNLGVRAGYRIVPGQLRAWAYGRFLADR